jgi:hypothetical protein
VAAHLLPGESHVVTVRRHWTVLARSLLLPGLSALVVVSLNLFSLPGEARVLLTLGGLALVGL